MKKLLVSSCLLGVACRYDGGRLDIQDCRRRIDRLSRRYHLVPVCPEQLGGLPTPRKPMSFRWLPGDHPGKPSGEAVDSAGVNRTAELKAGARQCADLARELGIRKALLKERSPSCGVKTVYSGAQLVQGQGLTTLALRRAGLEVLSEEEEDRLFD